jgi:hypothetical protein
MFYEKRAILFLCQESNQNSSYVQLHSLFIIPISVSRLEGENLNYNKSIDVR